MRGAIGLLAVIIAVTGAAAAPAETLTSVPPSMSKGSSTVQGVVVAAPVIIEVAARDVVTAGRPTRIRAMVINQSTVPVSNVEVSLLLGEPFVLLGDATASVAEILPGGRRQVGWNVCAPAVGNAVGMVKVGGFVPGGLAFEVVSGGFVLQARTGPGRSGC